jgi:alpha-galactosidase
VDIDKQALTVSKARQEAIVAAHGAKITIKTCVNRRKAFEGCHYVVTSCEKNRVPYWIQDLEIPARYGVDHPMGENGGPCGQAHAMRNITMFMGITKDMREICPNAQLMNFTNPMSFLCTYFARYGGIRALGFCHQVHGSFGVIAEMLGYEPGELEVISGGVNHFNWLIDIRRRGTGESFKEEFFARVKKNKWFKKHYENVPENVLTREILQVFGEYPIGYDDHIGEYLPFFPPKSEWKKRGITSRLVGLRKELKKNRRWAEQGATNQELQADQTRARSEYYNVPFPKDGDHPYYQEKPTEVMEAFATNTPHYMNSIVIPNNGAIDNLPSDALVDIPAIAVGGEVRGIHVGPLPTFAMELCRRQITIHELLVEATVEGSKQKLVQSMALDPYVRTIDQAVKIADAYLKAYGDELPQF